jgi:hypothetical protein
MACYRAALTIPVAAFEDKEEYRANRSIPKTPGPPHRLVQRTAWLMVRPRYLLLDQSSRYNDSLGVDRAPPGSCDTCTRRVLALSFFSLSPHPIYPALVNRVVLMEPRIFKSFPFPVRRYITTGGHQGGFLHLLAWNSNPPPNQSTQY